MSEARTKDGIAIPAGLTANDVEVLKAVRDTEIGKARSIDSLLCASIKSDAVGNHYLSREAIESYVGDLEILGYLTVDRNNATPYAMLTDKAIAVIGPGGGRKAPAAADTPLSLAREIYEWFRGTVERVIEGEDEDGKGGGG